MTPSRDISRLIEIMAALRTPVTGCPWDLEQNFATIAPYTIEEAYEVADAISRGDFDDLRDELGDLLLQVVYHARMAEEQNAFAFGDVVEAVTRKMIRRHPHVFADEHGRLTPAGVNERVGSHQGRGKGRARRAAAAARLLRRRCSPASRPGSRHSAARSTCSARLPASASTGTTRARSCEKSARKPTRSRPRSTAATRRSWRKRPAISCLRVVNLARHVDANPEMALRGANAKFERRFGYIERTLAAKGRSLEEATLRRDGRAVG